MADVIRSITGEQPLVEQILPASPAATNTKDSEHPDDETPLNSSDITFHTANGPMHLDVMATSATTAHALAGTTNVTSKRSLAMPMPKGNNIRHKRSKYHPLPVTPLLLEAHGRFGESFLQFLRQLAATLPTPAEQTAAYHHAIQRISTTLQRNNAQTIIAHLTPTTSAAAASTAAATDST